MKLFNSNGLLFSKSVKQASESQKMTKQTGDKPTPGPDPRRPYEVPQLVRRPN